jgi:hypothetical protein
VHRRTPSEKNPDDLLMILEELKNVLKREEQVRHDFRHAMKPVKSSGKFADNSF